MTFPVWERLKGMDSSTQSTTVTQIGVAMFTVSDQDAALAFYTEKLGFELRSDTPFGENGEYRRVEVAPPGSTGPQAVLLVPSLERPRFVVDAGVPLDKVGGTPATWLTPGPGFLPAGRVIVHDRLGDRPAEAFAVLEVAQPTAIGSVTLLPAVADPTAGLWVLWIARTGDGSPPSCRTG